MSVAAQNSEWRCFCGGTSVGQTLFLNKYSHEPLSPKVNGQVHARIFQNFHHSFIHSVSQPIMTTWRWFTPTADVWQEFHLLARSGTTPTPHLIKKFRHQLNYTRSWSTLILKTEHCTTLYCEFNVTVVFNWTRRHKAYGVMEV